MRKCKGCNECSGMCRESWEPLTDTGHRDTVLTFIVIILALAGIAVFMR